MVFLDSEGFGACGILIDQARYPVRNAPPQIPRGASE